MVSQLSSRMRERLARFLGNVSEGLCRRASVFVGEMVYGILASGSVVLTRIGRQLGEPISLKQTEKRLSRNLARRELAWAISAGLLRDAAPRIGRDTLLILDPTDICKPHARKMEYLATIRDGSEKRLGKGYWMVSVVAANTGERSMIPLWSQVFSQESPDFISENTEILAALQRISRATEGRGVWVIDRGGDRGRLFEELLRDEAGYRFVIRLRGDRLLEPARGSAAPAADLAMKTALVYEKTLVREQGDRSRAITVRFGARRVRLPNQPDTTLWLVVATGLGSQPLLLLTNCLLRRTQREIRWVLDSYLTRWSIEETIRWIKQAYELEDVRVLTFQRLRNLVWLVTLAAYFLAVLVTRQNRLWLAVIRLVDVSKPLFGMPRMPLYALSRGIATVFSRHPRAPRPPRPPSRPRQLPLFET